MMMMMMMMMMIAGEGDDYDLAVHHDYELCQVNLPVVVDIHLGHDAIHLHVGQDSRLWKCVLLVGDSLGYIPCPFLTEFSTN